MCADWHFWLWLMEAFWLLHSLLSLLLWWLA